MNEERMNTVKKGSGAVLAAAMITSFITPFMGSALNLSVPALEMEFHVNAATVSWVITAYTMAVAAMSLPFGKIADVRGRRRVFLLGIAGFGLLCLASVFSVSFGMLITFRALQGVFASMIFATNNAILISSYPHSMQGRVLGFSIGATYVGLMAGPVLGGILNSKFGWRSIFVLMTLIAAVTLAVGIRFIPRDQQLPDTGNEKRDVKGTVLYAAAILLSLYGMTDLTVSGRAKVFFVVGLALIALFFVVESRTENPMMKVTLFTESRAFTFSNLAALLNYGATFAISYILSLYLQLVKGFSSDKAGLILIAMPLIMAVFSPVMGNLSDRIRPALLASVGMGLCAAALLLFSRIDAGTPLSYTIIVLIIAGLGFAMFSSPNNNAIMNCVEKKDFSVANSIIATMRTYGQSSGMALFNIVTGIVLGKSTLEAAPAGQIVKTMHLAFIVFMVVCVIGLVFSLARDKEQKG